MPKKRLEKFIIYNDGEELPPEDSRSLEKAMGTFFCSPEEGSGDGENARSDAFLCADVPLAIEFIFTDEEEIRRLNRELRGVDKVTDVLSFPALDGIRGKPLRKKDYPCDVDDEGNLFIGSVAVCVKRAEEQAEEYGHSYRRELLYLLVHGILHCLGYDHVADGDRAQMREKEEAILGRLGVPRE